MQIKRQASAEWNGAGLEGKGHLTTPSNVLKTTTYSFKQRFQDEPGTNPEELIAAAHAGCFSMALSFQLSGAGFKPDSLKTTATITLEKKEGGWEFIGIHLELTGQVPGIDNARFQELAGSAKAGCPVSKALKAVPITLEAKLV